MIDADKALEGLSDLPVDEAFAIIREGDSEIVDILVGGVSKVQALKDIPLVSEEVLAMVPFRQIHERGFDFVDDGVPLCALIVKEKWQVSLSSLVDALPKESPKLTDFHVSMSDEEYADVARSVIRDEIGRGEGANFVIRRDFFARTTEVPRRAILAWLRRLLVTEQGAYWTYAMSFPGLFAVGASPERHVSAKAGTVMMNPISGTLRHVDHQPSSSEVLSFLSDRKEREELVMVVDEELKMMSAVCPDGGVMRGPFLKPMSRLTHTEYLLEGQSNLDPREILRLTMFAPTVTGSPVENACRIIAKYEKTGRGYYSGVLARFTPTTGGYDLDAPILIRTAFLDEQGNVSVSAGATLVRHSDPLSESAETQSKAGGVLNALGLDTDGGNHLHQSAVIDTSNDVINEPSVLAALADRNTLLAPFWRDEQTVVATFDAKVLIVDCEDDFTTMLAHQLRRMGLTVERKPWHEVIEVETPDLVVFGPGPGDPLNMESKRISTLHKLIQDRLGKPLIAVCLSHQILASLAGLPIQKLPKPRQGLPLSVDIMGKDARVGFYNTFSAVAPNGSRTPALDLRVLAEEHTGFVHSLTGPNLASVQGHLESVLSYDGFAALTRLVAHTLV